jgi:hypothetical protein
LLKLKSNVNECKPLGSAGGGARGKGPPRPPVPPPPPVRGADYDDDDKTTEEMREKPRPELSLAQRQGLTLVHVRAQFEQIQDTFRVSWVTRWTKELKLS